MAKTRTAYGHDVPSRAGAANTVMYHQILGFNPDECSCNGGKMTPEKCMEYAKEYLATRYPNQEAVWVPGIAKGLGIAAARLMMRSMDEGLER